MKADRNARARRQQRVRKRFHGLAREARDATLDIPRLILPSLQVNMRAGHLPPVEDNGMRYLKILINAFKK